jgi:hypothetical protein
MYCNNCGEQLSAVARFCSQCGTVRSGQKLNGTTQAAFDAHKYKMGILGAMGEYYEKALNDWTITPHQAADILEELKKFVKFRGSLKKSARSRERSPINGPNVFRGIKIHPRFLADENGTMEQLAKDTVQALLRNE